MRLGQEFSGYAAAGGRSASASWRRRWTPLCELAIGGTAVGTGLNTHPRASPRTCAGC